MLRSLPTSFVVFAVTSGSIACDPCGLDKQPAAPGLYGYTTTTSDVAGPLLELPRCPAAIDRTLEVFATDAIVTDTAAAVSVWREQGADVVLSVRGWFEQPLAPGPWLVCVSENGQGACAPIAIDDQARFRVVASSWFAGPLIDIERDGSNVAVPHFDVAIEGPADCAEAAPPPDPSVREQAKRAPPRGEGGVVCGDDDDCPAGFFCDESFGEGERGCCRECLRGDDCDESMTDGGSEVDAGGR